MDSSRTRVIRRLGGLLVLAVVVAGATRVGATQGDPDASPSPVPTPTPYHDLSAAPRVTPPPSSKTVRVTTIPALLRTLADDSVDVIIVKDGTYHVSPSNETLPDSLWIGKAYADRTRPITVLAETRGGVIFDGGGGEAYGGLSFEDGAHHQTWDGFTFANMEARLTGIIEIGGYTPRRSPHHITLRGITILGSNTGRATTREGKTLDHAFYIAHSLGTGPYALTFEDISVDGRGGLASAFHFFHSEDGAPNASDVTVRRLRVVGTQQAIILWDPTMHDVTFDDVTVDGALTYAVRYEEPGSTGILIENITSTNSGCEGFYSSLGPDPPGLTLRNTAFDGDAATKPPHCP